MHGGRHDPRLVVAGGRRGSGQECGSDEPEARLPPSLPKSIAEQRHHEPAGKRRERRGGLAAVILFATNVRSQSGPLKVEMPAVDLARKVVTN